MGPDARVTAAGTGRRSRLFAKCTVILLRFANFSLEDTLSSGTCGEVANPEERSRVRTVVDGELRRDYAPWLEGGCE